MYDRSIARLGEAENAVVPERTIPHEHANFDGSAILRRILSDDSSGDSRTSVFRSEIGGLQRMLLLHGIDLEENNCMLELQIKLLQHLFEGGCIANSERYEFRRDRTGCMSLAKGFRCPADISVCAVNVVLEPENIDKNMSIDSLWTVARSLGLHKDVGRNPRRDIKSRLARQRQIFKRLSKKEPENYQLEDIEKMDKVSLTFWAARHQIAHEKRSTRDELKSLIMKHISSGKCLEGAENKDGPECAEIASQASPEWSNVELQVSLLTRAAKTFKRVPLKRLLEVNGIECGDEPRKILRQKLRKHINVLKKGKRRDARYQEIAHEYNTFLEKKRDVIDEWPKTVPRNLKDRLLENFRKMTDKEALSTFTCASCAEDAPVKERKCVPVSDINTNLLRRPDRRSHKDDPVVDSWWLDSECTPPQMPFHANHLLADVLVDSKGVTTTTSGLVSMSLCKHCCYSLKRGKTPALALANHNFLGETPSELKDLTVVEEAMIARCRSKCWIIQMKQDSQEDDVVLPHAQRGMKGHIIVYPQRPSAVSQILPPSMEEMTTPICVVFVGSSPPTEEWLRNKAKPLIVRKEKVRAALIWLKKHNQFYKNIEINHTMLDGMPQEQVLPVRIEHVLPDEETNGLTSRYDSGPSAPHQEDESSLSSRPIPFQNVVVTDVEGNAPANELRAAAVRHITEKGGGYMEIPHDPEPANEFCNPSLFPMIYPSLFPYGIGGFENEHRSSALSMKRQVKHLFSLSDRRFQEHYSFLFTAFNMLQRRSVLLHTSLKVDKHSFRAVANDFASVSPQAVHVVSERVSRGDFSTAKNDEERRVLNLMKQVKMVTSHVQGSSASRLRMRNEIRGLMFDRGLPSFYITINPADVYNPVLKFLSGSEIDVDNLLPDEVPKYHEQAFLVAKNPAVAAKFFNIYMKAFISALLGFDPKQKDLDGGILGVTKAYYGCVEHQGRGTLHCHMMVWLEGGLNPDEIKRRVIEEGDGEFGQRLIAFLEDTISSCIPDDPEPSGKVPSSEHHPCSVRALNPHDQDPDAFEKLRQKDLHNIVEQCQTHKHSGTCYKYWKGPPEPKECRFDLDPENVRITSEFDPETGELCLRCLDGMVNNFNATIIEAIRCNMDIKFIGSGGCAKAVLYYITDYITKQQLKAHVAFAALELAVRKLGEYDPEADEVSVRAKRLLQKCAHALISHQELSAQLVCCYLMDLEDHFTSHRYANLYWTSLERCIEAQDPQTKLTRNEEDIQFVVHEGSPCDDEPELEEENEMQSDDLNESTDPVQRQEQVEDLDDEVRIGVDELTGQLVMRGDQIADYTYRGMGLSDVCVWDFVSQVEKYKITSKNKDQELEDNSEPEENDQDEGYYLGETAEALLDEDVDESLSENDDDAMVVVDDEDDSHNSDLRDTDSWRHKNCANGSMLSIRTRVRPRCELLQGHVEAETHGLKVVHPDRRAIPVPIGPAFPRRDREDVYERYCRTMLILFKPWRNACDLRNPNQSWADAFNGFLSQCSEKHRAVINNMQMLHECKDSRDDHFIRRGSQRRDRSRRVSREMMGDNPVDDDLGMAPEEEEQVLLDHVLSISQARSRHLAAHLDTAKECLKYGEAGGLFSSNRFESTAMGFSDTHHDASNSQDCLEDVWQTQYENRRNEWKKKSSRVVIVPNKQDKINAIETSLQNRGDYLGSPMVVDEPPNTMLAEMRQDVPAPNYEINVDLSEMIAEHTLNAEQARAFRIVGEHSLKEKPDPLHMYLGGPGGTGKSRVIKALKDFFDRRNESRRFRLSSFTGVAARNISGMTLHAACSIGLRSRGTGRGRSHRDLVTMWDGVDYLFIDEVSMISCNFLTTISESLCEAKGRTSAFGGVNVIFAGDFAQLPPVGEARLYSRLKTSGAGRIAGQKAVFGKLLWLSVRTVVILTQIMRQSGDGSAPFVELLGRLREGKCTQGDFEMLNTRLIENAKPDWSDPNWRDVPLIVRNNAEKDAVNTRSAEAYAHQTGKEIHWYYAVDSRKGKALQDENLRNALSGLHSGKTKMRLGRLPLVIGMPVMITQNFCVPDGVVNGCSGILKRIRYKVDQQGKRYATSCVVHAQDTSGNRLHQLPEKHVVSIRDTVDLHFVDPYSQKKMKISRTQVPIVPAFAMTAHKAQGQTLEKAIIDLESCSGTESPYVMVSRVKSLQGLLILRPFVIDRIRSRPSEDCRKEASRLEILRLRTIQEHGSVSERTWAQNELVKAGFQEQMQSSSGHEDVDTQKSPREVDRRDPYRRLEKLQQQQQYFNFPGEKTSRSKPIRTQHRKRDAPGPVKESRSKRRRT